MTVVKFRCVLTLVLTLGLCATTNGQSGDPATRSQAAERAMSEGRYGEAAAIYRELVDARPADVRSWWMLAKALAESGNRIEAVAALRRVTALEPKRPSAWYALGQGYNDIKQDALATFNQPQDAAWRQLLAADPLLEKGPLPDAFVLYRATLEQLPSIVS